jgi:urease accessory protein
MNAIVYGALSLFFWGLGVTPAGAHVGHAEVGTFAGGVAHPFGGIDHLLAAFAVGLWAARSGLRSAWLLPCAFVAAMTVAALIGASGMQLPFAEAAIAASVIGLGLLIASAVRPSLATAAALVVLFAALHGHAHGAEGGAAAPYLAGLVVATGALHAAGLVSGMLPFRLTPMLARAAGAVVATAGVALLIA